MKKTINAVLLSSLFFIGYSSAAVTVEDLLKSQQQIKAPMVGKILITTIFLELT